MMKRRYKVGVKPGYSDNKTPEIRIGGKWLSKIGINVGDMVDLSVDKELIIISTSANTEVSVEEHPSLDAQEPQFQDRMNATEFVNSILLKCR